MFEVDYLQNSSIKLNGSLEVGLQSLEQLHVTFRKEIESMPIVIAVIS